ncbi:XopAK family type III secretion system effector (plasmid) [Ralstonia sp. R-29]|uniref:XopAK family type III secretion system effector n=1 Tax=Ralstonia sp. R-29 TaxID=3404059 RepID=UPI003CF9ABD2
MSTAAATSQRRNSPEHGDGPAGPHTLAQPLGQEMRPDGRQIAPNVGHTLQPSGSADFYFTHAGPLTETDRLPYRLLETLHQDLFSSPEIQQVASGRGLPIGKVMDVDLNEFEAINATAGEYASIGTKALSTCIAVCARGRNARGESILGLHHYDGRNSADGALAELDARMKSQGSPQNHYYLVGGMVLPADSGLGSYPAEADLLVLRDRYDIRGAKLHVLEGEYDANGNENMLNVVVTPNHILFSKKDLYWSD